MLPLLANPLPPPFGLVLIGVASKMPRTLLTPQFWTEGQAMRFARADGADARRRHAKLLAELAATTGAPGGESPADLDLGAVGDAFGAGSALALEKLKLKLRDVTIHIIKAPATGFQEKQLLCGYRRRAFCSKTIMYTPCTPWTA